MSPWGEEINFFLNAEAGARYALFLSTEEEEPYGNVSLQEPKRFLSMEADIPDTFEAFSVESELSELPVTVRYQDESSEIVSGWTTDWEEELGCNSMHAETSQGQRLLMYLTDADDNPADLPDYGYNIPVGPLQPAPASSGKRGCRGAVEGNPDPASPGRGKSFRSRIITLR